MPTPNAGASAVRSKIWTMVLEPRDPRLISMFGGDTELSNVGERLV